MSTLNINIWGGPGTGKSIVAAQLFTTLKLQGVSCDMAREFAKELTWAKAIHQYEQLEISTEQYRRQRTLQGTVSVVVTDAAIPQGTLYAPESYRENLLQSLIALTQDWRSLNVLLHPAKGALYEQAGRSESPEGAEIRHELVCDLARRLCGASLLEVTLPEAVPAILKAAGLYKG